MSRCAASAVRRSATLDSVRAQLYADYEQHMADNPTPPPAPQPPPGGTPSKKQTVRISLPPKPTATIKLPTLPAGGPAPAAAPAPAASAPAAPAAHAAPPPTAARPAPPAPPSGAPGTRVASAPPKSAPAAAASTPAARPVAPAAAPRRVSGLDLGLAIAAAVVGLGAVGSLLMLLTLK